MKNPLAIPALILPLLAFSSSAQNGQQPPVVPNPAILPVDEGLTLAQRSSQYAAQVLIAQDTLATPQARGQAAVLALDLMTTVDPQQAAAFAEAMAQDPLMDSLSAATKAALKVRLAGMILMTSGPAAAEGLLVEAESAQPNSAEIAARAALVRAGIAQATGRSSDRQEIANALGAAVQNTALPLQVRMDAGAARISAFINYGTESNLQVAALGEQLVALTGTSVSESASHARAVVLASKVVTLPDELRQQQEGLSVTQNAFAYALDGLFISLYEQVTDLETAVMTQCGPNSRAYAICLSAHVKATVQVSHQEPADEANLLAECRAAVDKLIAQPHPWIDSQKIRSLKYSTAIRFELDEDMGTTYTAMEQELADPATSQQAALFVLSTLAPYAQTHPQEASAHWKKAIDVFAHTVRELAVQNPDQAVNSLGAWNSTWASYEVFPKSGQVQDFLEAYSEITGIVKTVPYQSVNSSNVEVLLGDVNLADIQQELSAVNPMLVFVRFSDPMKNVAEGGSYGAFLLKGGSSITYFDLGDAAPIEDAIKAWEDSITGPGEAPPVGDPMVTGAALYNHLLEPVFGSDLPSDLYIVPDGRIGDVSFAALVTPESQWVVEESAITYVAAMRDVVATPYPPQSPSQVLFAKQFKKVEDLSSPDLTTKAMAVLDPGAVDLPLSLERLRSIKGPRYLHISTHGRYVAPTVPGPDSIGRASTLILPGQSGDAQITANEIARLDLRGTQLATLAVCDGGRADVLAGEGVGGLRRALQLAGAAQVIASVRNVYSVHGREEAPGDYLLSLVYQSHRKGVSPARSLRQAQIMMCRKHGPAYWAGFICEGR